MRLRVPRCALVAPVRDRAAQTGQPGRAVRHTVGRKDPSGKSLLRPAREECHCRVLLVSTTDDTDGSVIRGNNKAPTAMTGLVGTRRRAIESREGWNPGAACEHRISSLSCLSERSAVAGPREGRRRPLSSRRHWAPLRPGDPGEVGWYRGQTNRPYRTEACETSLAVGVAFFCPKPAPQ